MDSNKYLVMEAIIYSAKANGGDFAFVEDAWARCTSQGMSGMRFNTVLAEFATLTVIQISSPVKNETGTHTQITF